MGRKFLAVLFLVGASLSPGVLAQLALPSTIRLKAIDARTGAALANVSVAASESFYWTGYHASGSECFRAASVVLAAADGKGRVTLPAAGPLSNGRPITSNRNVEVIAYRAGYCVAQPLGDAHMAGFQKWANKQDPRGGWGKAPPDPAGKLLTLEMVPTKDPPEHRIRYLLRVAYAMGGLCREGGRGYMASPGKAILEEASGIATTPLERFLVLRIADAVGNESPQRLFLNPLRPPAGSGDVRMLEDMFARGAKDPMFDSSYPYSSPGGTYSFTSPGLVRQPFHIDMRDEKGLTALMNAAKEMQIVTARLMLQRGAGINVLSSPDGHNALDLVLAKAASDVRDTGTEGQQIQLLRMIELLAGTRPAPTLHPAYFDELSRPEAWSVGSGRREFWEEVRRRTAPLKRRTGPSITCLYPSDARLDLGLLPKPADAAR